MAADVGIAEPADMPRVVAVAGRGAQRLREQLVELRALGRSQPVQQRIQRVQPGGADAGRRRPAALGEANLDGPPVIPIAAQVDQPFEAGAVASLAGVRTSIVSGGVMCVVGTGVVLALLPAFWHYDARRPAPREEAPAGSAAG
jgi:hypothetical protein